MTDDSIWDHLPDTPMARTGAFRLTMIERPFPGPYGSLPPHDHARARGIAASLTTVEEITAELGSRHVGDEFPHETRADLEQIRVGCWGPVTEITDAAFAHRGEFVPLAEHAEALAKLHPNAALIGSVTVDFSIRYRCFLFIHPDGTRLWADGWAGEAPWTVNGNVHDTIDAFAAHNAAEGIGFDADAEPGVMAWDELEDAVLRTVMPVGRRRLMLSVFRVRRPREVAVNLEETWLEE
ncbi:DUF6333 family protein [Streptomyces sp. NBC_01618]|uniref:DUF6333 family protein n=1 Tax=Streptomyces sp. NBC_01618 TaxID=2975900 RepID=UPI00386F93F6|nr:DUF6333 family protein [Streptomyces sp. NBC_01618]